MAEGSGGERRCLDVVGQPEAMARWRLTLAELEAAVTAATGTAAGSSLADGPDQSLLRGVARPTTPWALGGALVRPAVSGAPALRLADVAELRWGAMPRIGAATASGAGETVYAMVQMLRGDNALQALDAAFCAGEGSIRFSPCSCGENHICHRSGFGQEDINHKTIVERTVSAAPCR